MSYVSGTSEVCFFLVPASEAEGMSAFAEDDTGTYIKGWHASLGPQPTEQQVADAKAGLTLVGGKTFAQWRQARIDDVAQYQTDRATLKTQIAQEIADIDTFLAIASPNNAAVLAEVRAIDRRLKAMLKFIRRL